MLQKSIGNNKKEVIRHSSRAKICISKSKCDNTIQNFCHERF